MNHRLAFTLICVLLPTASAAQSPDLAPGDPVRATYRPETDEAAGTVTVDADYVHGTPERIRLSLDADAGTTVEVPLERLIRLEVPDGRDRGAGAGRGALWGGGFGAVLGGVMGGMCASRNGSFFSCSGSDVAAAVAVLGGLGAGAGALIGAGIGVRQWQEVPLRGPEDF